MIDKDKAVEQSSMAGAARQGGITNDKPDCWTGHEIMNDPSLDFVEFVKLSDVEKLLATQASTSARDAVLEKAARICEAQNDTDWPTPLGCAKAIRAMKAASSAAEPKGGEDGQEAEA